MTPVEALIRAKSLVNEPSEYDRIGASGALDLATRGDKILRRRVYDLMRSARGPTDWADFYAAHARFDAAIKLASTA